MSDKNTQKNSIQKSSSASKYPHGSQSAPAYDKPYIKQSKGRSNSTST